MKKINDKEHIFLTIAIILVGVGFFFILLSYDGMSPTGKAITYANISRAAPEMCNFTIFQGYNLVSFHCISSITSREYFLENIHDNYSAIFAYNPESVDSWISHNPDLPSWVVQDLYFIDNRRGYWILMKNESRFVMNGSVPSTEKIPLSLNWNLIGYPNNESELIGAALASIDGNYTIIMEYNATSGLWTSAGPLGTGTLDRITPDRGYWIFMNSTDELNLTT